MIIMIFLGLGLLRWIEEDVGELSIMMDKIINRELPPQVYNWERKTFASSMDYWLMRVLLESL